LNTSKFPDLNEPINLANSFFNISALSLKNSVTEIPSPIFSLRFAMRSDVNVELHCI
jgi:hypothetical protein